MKHRRTLRALVAPAALIASTFAFAACGSDSGGDSSADSEKESEYTVLKLVSAEGAGGTEASVLTWLQTDESAADYAGQFTGPLKDELTTAFEEADVPEGDNLFASIVSVGCGEPTTAFVFRSFEGVVISPSPAPSAEGCATKTTTVAIVAGPPPQ